MIASHCNINCGKAGHDDSLEAGKPPQHVQCSPRESGHDAVIAFRELRAVLSRRRSRMSPLSLSFIVLVNPFADSVISFDEGVVDSPGYNISSASLGEPARFTGEGIWPGVVSPFNAAWLADEIVSIGVGGSLTVHFDEPVTDNQNNPFGIDLIIFGNTGLIDNAWPAAIIGGVFSDDGGSIEVSANGKEWVTVTSTLADGIWPTCGFVDSEPYDGVEGIIETNFTLPIDSRLTLELVMGLNSDELKMYYGNSGGGNGIDLAETGLSEISYVRINASSKLSPEIDAISDVTAQLPGDADLNGMVNVNDLLIVIDTFGPLPIGGPLADFNHDFEVNITDLLILIGNWS